MEGKDSEDNDSLGPTTTDENGQDDQVMTNVAGKDTIFNVDDEEVKRKKKRRKIGAGGRVHALPDDNIVSFDYSNFLSANDISATAGNGANEGFREKRRGKDAKRAGKGDKKVNPYLSKSKRKQ